MPALCPRQKLSNVLRLVYSKAADVTAPQLCAMHVIGECSAKIAFSPPVNRLLKIDLNLNHFSEQWRFFSGFTPAAETIPDVMIGGVQVHRRQPLKAHGEVLYSAIHMVAAHWFGTACQSPP